MKFKLKILHKKKVLKWFEAVLGIAIILGLIIFTALQSITYTRNIQNLNNNNDKTATQLNKISKELEELKNQDQKKSVKSTRGFVANKGNTVYIGIVHGASVADSAKTMKALGMENAMNLDGGGTTTFWYGGGYKAGPGRDLTNAILFVRK